MLRRIVFPLTILLGAPALVGFLWRTVSGAAPRDLVLELWAKPTPQAAATVAAFLIFELALWGLLPGRTCAGPLTPSGSRVVYKMNGLAAWAVTHLLLIAASFGFHWFSLAGIYHQLGPILTVCTMLGWALAVFAYARGRWFASGADAAEHRGFLYDFAWGLELHPRLFGLDLKHFLITRFGMMSWSVILLVCAARQYERDGFLSDSLWIAVGLQLLYIVKFFYWESGYLGTLDLSHDRFGFYLAWGSVAWMPYIYPLSTQYLVTHRTRLGPAEAAALAMVGAAAILANYSADRQRQRVRETSGRCTVHGKPPALIPATYRTADGRVHQNLLLASGWWGVARHSNYLMEIVAALAWTIPCGFAQPAPYTYVLFLTGLLIHRALRDDERCLRKYGSAWLEYRGRVPYRIMPGVF
jgi:7-dehydrocholesterol reductase